MAKLQECLKSETYSIPLPLSKKATVVVLQTSERKTISLVFGKGPSLILDITPGYHTQGRTLSSLESCTNGIHDGYAGSADMLPKLSVSKIGGSKDEGPAMILQQIAYLQQLYGSLSPEIQDSIKYHLHDASEQTAAHMREFYYLSQICQPGLGLSLPILPSYRKSLRNSLDTILSMALGWELLKELSKKQAEYLMDGAMYLYRTAKTPFAKNNSQKVNSLVPFYSGIEDIAHDLLQKIDAPVCVAVQHLPKYGGIKKEAFRRIL